MFALVISSNSTLTRRAAKANDKQKPIMNSTYSNDDEEEEK